MPPSFKPDDIVRNPKCPQWGPGKILSIAGGKAKIFFRDDGEKDIRTLALASAPIELAPELYDPCFDHLPQFDGERFEGKAKRVTFAQGWEFFLSKMPGGFEGEAYLAEGSERAYKIRAHSLFVETLGEGQGLRLLEDGQVEEVASRVLAIDAPLNLISKWEKMALHDGLKADERLAKSFLETTLALIGDGEPTQARLEACASALLDLPAEKGSARVATWPVLTQLPFIARPDRFMFVKPGVVKKSAAMLRWEINYRTELNWRTYDSIGQMSRWLFKELQPLGARDLIDVQSFLWVVEEY